jgi:DNA-binding NarL/FixJ family response regulator
LAIRVLVVDDGEGKAHAIRRSFLRSDGIEPIGTTASGREGIRLALDFRPDVLVATTGLVDPTAFELTRFLKLRLPALGVVVLASAENEEELYEAVRVGISAYLPRTAEGAAVLQAVRQAAMGNYLIDDLVLTHPRVAARVLRDFRERNSAQADISPLMAPVSAREIEILDHIARGNSNKQIARRLSISDQTVKNHISSILRKLAVNDRTQAVVYALRHGWIRIDSAS